MPESNYVITDYQNNKIFILSPSSCHFQKKGEGKLMYIKLFSWQQLLLL